jgi:signal transduction histidine kinase
MEISFQGTVKRGKRSTLTIMVSNFETGVGIARASLRAKGAGVRARRLRTDLFGGARLVFRARRGTLVVTARKPGYRRASARFRVR